MCTNFRNIVIVWHFNPLECRGNIATSNNMKLVHWPLMDGLLHWYNEEGMGGAPGPSSLY